jgi:hypothetical protein
MEFQIKNTDDLVEFLKAFGMNLTDKELKNIISKSLPGVSIIICKVTTKTDLQYIIKQIKASHLPFDIKTLYCN